LARAPNTPQITPRTRRRARHIIDNYYIGPARDPDVLEIWAYSDSFSYRPGDTVSLHISTTADHYDVEIGRDGAGCDVVKSWTGLVGVHHPTPEDCSVTGCGWPVSLAFEIPNDWVPGGYLITLTGYRGEERVEEHHLILVRQGEVKAPILLVCATGTWVAYNCWGGSNAYDGIEGPDGNRFSYRLSLERPWTRGFCKLPQGAPRSVPEAPTRPGDMVRYPYMEWAYAYGYSKKYASAGWASYERHFAVWAEREGYHVDFAALHDLETDPSILEGYKCAVFVGHDEYWSAPMRHAVDRWVEKGGRAARFAGNFLWQIRLEDEGRTQVCHKYHALETDPLMGTDQQGLLTGVWEMPEVDWPGAATFAANGLRGVYASLGNCVGGGAGGFTVYRPEHWVFEGAHLGYGDVLGTRSRIYGYEVDGLDHEIRDGLPYPTGTDGADASVEILALGMATNIEADHSVWGEHLYIGSDDAVFKAKALYGDNSPETVDKVARGNGVIVHWPRGKGAVFNAATCDWIMGLTRGDAQVEQITRNVLNRFTA